MTSSCVWVGFLQVHAPFHVKPLFFFLFFCADFHRQRTSFRDDKHKGGPDRPTETSSRFVSPSNFSFFLFLGARHRPPRGCMADCCRAKRGRRTSSNAGIGERNPVVRGACLLQRRGAVLGGMVGRAGRRASAAIGGLRRRSGLKEILLDLVELQSKSFPGDSLLVLLDDRTKGIDWKAMFSNRMLGCDLSLIVLRRLTSISPNPSCS